MAQTAQAHGAQPESAQEITMRVYVKQDGEVTRFITVAGKAVAMIEYIGDGKYFFTAPRETGCGLTNYAECVEKVSDAICGDLAQYGINVEFINK